MTKKPLRRRTPSQKRSEFTVNTILQAAGEMIVDAGDKKLTTNAVAERAGVSIGKLYQYFSNKEALVAALRQDHEDQVRRALRGAASDVSIETSDQMMLQMIRANMHVHLSDPRLHRALTVDNPTAGVVSKHAVCVCNADANDILRLTEERCSLFLPEFDAETQVRPMLVGVWRMVESLTHTLVVDCPPRASAGDLEKIVMTSCLAYVDTMIPEKYRNRPI